MRETGKPKISTVRRLPSPFRAEDTDEEIVTKVAAFYAGELAKDASAIGYLEAQKVSAEAVQTHALGVGNRSLGLHLPSKNRKRGAALRGRLEALGILRETGHEQLFGCIVVPLLSATGHVVSLYGHKIDARYGGRHFFTKSMPVELRSNAEGARGVFNAPALVGAEHVVIADTVMSALAVWTSGTRAVTALHGAEEPLDEVVAAVGEAKRVTLALARTAELAKVTSALIARLSEMHIEVLRAVLPATSDATEVLAGEDGAYRLGQLIRTAEWAGGAADAGLAEHAARQRAASAESPAGESQAEPSASDARAEHERVYSFADRRWRVRGLAENTAPGTLRVNVFVSRTEAGFFVDSFDLYSARHRKSFLQQAALELGTDEATLKRDLGQVLLWLEIGQAEMLAAERAAEVKAPVMSERERAEALELLADPKLLERVLGAFEAMGVVGERDNLLAGYLVAVSRKLEQPLAMVIQSSTAAGKTALFEAILSMVPEEERASYAAVSGQSLYYMGKRSLRHRLLSIAEEAGAEKASHALKLLQSSKELVIASTGKDGASGRITSHEYKVEGPVALMITTSHALLDEELLHRCLVCGVDESPAQTEAVQAAQRRAQTLEGVLCRERRLGLERLHQNAQRLLRPLVVVNPHAEAIAFSDRRVRARTEHQKLLSLIEAIALVHQHQRPVKSHVVMGSHALEYIEATAEDVALAARLMQAIGGDRRDELGPRTRELVTALGGYVEEKKRAGVARRPLTWTRREVREALGWGDTQLKTHLRRLVDAEIVIVHRADHGRGVSYELAFDASEASERAGHGRASVGGWSGLGRAAARDENPLKEAANATSGASASEIALRGLQKGSAASDDDSAPGDEAPSTRVPKAS
jgi:hypothetical protein